MDKKDKSTKFSLSDDIYYVFFYVFNIKWLGKWAMWENISLGGVIAVIIVRYSIQNDI